MVMRFQGDTVANPFGISVWSLTTTSIVPAGVVLSACVRL